MSHVNWYGQYFTHYNGCRGKYSVDEVKTKFNRYFDRFFKLLNSNKNVLFIHTHEEYIYHKKSRDNKVEFYNYLCKINDLLEEKYPNLKFDIINIDINNNFENYKNIVNLNAEYNLTIDYGGNIKGTHSANCYDPYRNEVTRLIGEYLHQ